MLPKQYFQLLDRIVINLFLLLSADLRKEPRVHFMRNELSILIKTVGIGICYHFGLSVSCIALNGLDIAPAQFQLQGGATVAQAVKDNRTKPGLLNQLMKHLVDHSLLIRASIESCNDQSIVPVLITQKRFILFLSF